MAAKTSIVTITPEYAKSLLERNPKNRPLNTETVKHYASEMSNGNTNKVFIPSVLSEIE